MATAAQLKRWGKDEAEEHGLTLKQGIKTAKEHVRLYGDAYYPKLIKLERSLKK
jgi:hypothetical protein